MLKGVKQYWYIFQRNQKMKNEKVQMKNQKMQNPQKEKRKKP